jgi:hypothetical protein
MAKNKYRVREFNPKAGQTGSHSIFVEAVIDNEITNNDLAKKIAARTGIKAYEAQAVVAAIADITMEEVLENNRITLATEDGTRMVSIYPKVTGSITDKDVQQNPDKYPGKTVAEESMLTPDMLTWTLGATIGIKFSKKFAIDKQAEKVAYNAAQTPAAPADDNQQGGGTQGGGSDNDDLEG